jgi:hypothetical protein
MGAEDQICQMDTVTLARGITAAGYRWPPVLAEAGL